MDSTAPAFNHEHPLLLDRDRLERILDVMYFQVQKKLGWAKRPRGKGPERTLPGGESANDILQQALGDLLASRERYPDSWEALAVTIARNKAIDALRASRKGWGGTDHRRELQIISGDATVGGTDGEQITTRFEVIPDESYNPEEVYLAIRSVVELRDLARELLNDREQVIFFGIRFQGRTRRDLGKELQLTGQRVGQIYEKAMRLLEVDPRYPYNIR